MNRAVLWLLNKLEKKYRIILLIFIQSLLSIVSLLYAFLFKAVIDAAFERAILKIRTLSIIFFLIVFVQGFFTAFLRRLQEITKIDFDRILKSKYIENIFKRDFSYVSSIHSGEWMNQISNDINIISTNAVTILPNVFGIIFHFGFALLFLFKLQPQFVLFITIVSLLVICLEFFFYKYIKVFHKRVQETNGALRSAILEHLNSLVVIKSYSKEEVYLSSLEKYFDTYREADLKKNLFSIIMNFFFGTGMNIVLVLSGLYCAIEIINGTIKYGTFVAVIQIITQLRSPLANAYVNIPNYYSMIGSIERLMEIEKYALEKVDFKKNTMKFYQNDFRAIDLENVCFSYKDNKNKSHVINDLSFTINKGDFVGISGPSGCGKSTLLKILLGLYMPDKGKIGFITKKETFVNLDSTYRQLFAYVPQDNQLMKGTIKDVVCFGEEYNFEKMNAALEISCCNEFVERLKDGIKTQLDEKGSGLSEGQMQRIAIARAIYSEHPILLLDESTSSLNETLELSVLNNIKELTNKTILLITHRKTSLNYADIIINCIEKEDGEYKWLVTSSH